MNCPNCQYVLSKKKFDKIEVDHCDNCGSTLFQPNQINRITLEDAQELAQMKRADSISGTEKFSPKDGSPLKRMEDESIPQHVTLLKSEKTGEVFAYPDDLVNFKTAQEAKLNYYEVWHIPLPALRTVLIYSFIIASTVSITYVASQLQKPASQSIQAASICQNGIQIIRTANELIVSCTTTAEFESRARIICGPSEEIIPVSSAPSSFHIATVPTTCDAIQFVFAQRKNILETEWIGLK
ncbi:hypothetical protein A3H80_04325 [Candidatus Roizmanbacteria bacterium RIFCSPLOWO2_02_FULL_37_19]|uniref:Transcription factor zinc-finger domain-containing protein n=1 Tax=Candidatus Roizmanbacteria bacterium RIFCSPHIGHO2_02_FULL_37_24 TaxID=1802037 RepID=A0A1F7GX53_9BACT|nr:MAG: hypothetical protein A2862_03955 [Candidatus Roizmanbacteria bacterium RIFCSPHIGHO2_01_FULL_38_41]OGK23116.1 MAG: hypothetical protein A3C24_01355 [Candidatus Roizmanbacteria bacterium RIFCSPHIGHO2_02_FULL_37_24]OGK32839.1 MAG: hypothetical protein A3E10_00015 [Candidatus Roizmanbacteria bacterium RIFCSPHIGHO2_12_FULL_37_23]OGK45484.1 MAG: hypothetical protein A2956_00145 [Candidatus Roizmanbacteria bacterium RIFCSPLOWO2_01_FULL_37_57]OGK54252.1 MAG: hypothetical protein A3H80_04325 [Ca